MPVRNGLYQCRSLIIHQVPDSSQGPTLQACLPKERSSQTCYSNSFLLVSPLFLTTAVFPTPSRVTLLCASQKPSLLRLHATLHCLTTVYLSTCISSYGSQTELLAESFLLLWPCLAQAWQCLSHPPVQVRMLFTFHSPGPLQLLPKALSDPPFLSLAL